MNNFSVQVYKTAISFLCWTLFSSTLLPAQDLSGMNGRLGYPVGKSFVIYDFGQNTSEIENLHTCITKTLSDASVHVREIEIVGYSSPEGDYTRHSNLASDRAEILHKYLLPFFPDIEFRVTSVPEDWEGLVDALTQTGNSATETVRAFASADLTPEQKERRLKKLPRRVYQDLSQNYFPLLRRASITIYYEQLSVSSHSSMLSEAEEKEIYLRTQYTNQAYRNAQFHHRNIQNSALTDRYGTTYGNKSERRVHHRSVLWQDFTPVIAVGTNLLQWAGFRPDFTHTTFVPNLYVEYYFLKRWSVKGAFSYCNWSYGDNKRFQGISSYSIEPRFWLRGDGNFRGFFFGVYGQFGDYNDEQEIESYTGRYHSEGLSAGYLLPLYKGLAIELSLRGGYRYSSVKRYQAGEECNSLCREYDKHDFTVTGSNIGLLYRF